MLSETSSKDYQQKYFQRKSLGILSSVDVDEVILEQKSDNLRFTASFGSTEVWMINHPTKIEKKSHRDGVPLVEEKLSIMLK